jgi:hypothetical protein
MGTSGTVYIYSIKGEGRKGKGIDRIVRPAGDNPGRPPLRHLPDRLRADNGVYCLLDMDSSIAREKVIQSGRNKPCKECDACRDKRRKKVA